MYGTNGYSVCVAQEVATVCVAQEVATVCVAQEVATVCGTGSSYCVWHRTAAGGAAAVNVSYWRERGDATTTATTTACSKFILIYPVFPQSVAQQLRTYHYPEPATPHQVQ